MRRLQFLIVVLSTLAVTAGPADAALIQFQSSLDGSQHTTPTGSAATGSATLLFDDVANTFDFSLTVTGLFLGDLRNVGPNATPLHLHLGAPGVNGGIIAEPVLFGALAATATGLSLTSFDVTLAAANVASLLAGNTYINVHTNAFPGGEIRGQVLQVGEPLTLTLFGLGLSGLAIAARRRRAT